MVGIKRGNAPLTSFVYFIIVQNVLPWVLLLLLFQGTNRDLIKFLKNDELRVDFV